MRRRRAASKMTLALLATCLWGCLLAFAMGVSKLVAAGCWVAGRGSWLLARGVVVVVVVAHSTEEVGYGRYGSHENGKALPRNFICSLPRRCIKFDKLTRLKNR